MDRDRVDPVKLKGRASYTELADFARKLQQAAQIVSDSFERNADHYAWCGGMNVLDDLDHELEKAKRNPKLAAVFYQLEDEP